jgi:quinone-modifying oxidoreductase subunit QmoB
MDKKTQAYICTGCGIGEGLDIDALSEVVSSEMSVECKNHAALCGSEGRALIEADISDGVNTIIVGACSPRVMQSEFTFGEDKIVARANLREQVVWCQGEDAQLRLHG